MTAQATPARGALPLGRQAAPPRQAAGFVRDTGAASAMAGTLIADASEQHALVIAPTGAGTGRAVLLPWLMSYRGSVIVVDPKGEAANVTARCRREALGQRVSVIDPWGIHAASAGARGESLNPLQVMLDASTDLGDDCMTLAELIVGEAPASTQDPFWRALALDLITASIGWAWVCALVTGRRGAHGPSLAAVWELLHADDLACLLATWLDAHGKHPALPRFVHNGFVTFLHHEAERVRTSVLSEAISLLRVFGSARVQAATTETTVPLAALCGDEGEGEGESGEGDGGAGEAGAAEGVSLYLVVPPDRLDSHAPYLRVMLGTLLGVMARRTARPSLPTLFLVDELGHLGPIPQLRQATTLLRGYGVRVALFVQSMAQLKSLWPREHESILENCGLWLNFGNNSLAAARQVAEQLGDVGAETLFQMPADHLAIHRAGQPTVIARKLDYLSDPLFKGRFDPNPLHAHSRSRSGLG